ncbi:LOW QUALITY PROTEIN: hypothetical protein IFM47457_09925 [Aspergillus lentulus]|nr:LOW QUALITY PROTEIN: hypothetical protein IFM47457_09925 [Aspergillus lentulus]
MNTQGIILFPHEPSSVGTRSFCYQTKREKGPATFTSSLDITFVGTAMAIIDVDGVTFFTDPMTEWNIGIAALKNTVSSALGLDKLPQIDVMYLSHEHRPDNLDELGHRIHKAAKS